jgi:hypothetical protein
MIRFQAGLRAAAGPSAPPQFADRDRRRFFAVAMDYPYRSWRADRVGSGELVTEVKSSEIRRPIALS